MLKVGTAQEGLWGWDPVPDDAQSLFGALADSPFEAAIALFLLLAIAVALTARGAAPGLTARTRMPLLESMPQALGGTAPTANLTNAPEGTARLQGPHTKLPLSFVESKGQSQGPLRSHAKRSSLDFHFTGNASLLGLTNKDHQHLLDLRLLAAKSNASLARGPPRRGWSRISGP
jgi:hypothetical protein